METILEGFVKAGKIKDWENWIKNVPTEKGVYAVIRESTQSPCFSPVGTGGFFKGKNPNVETSKLVEKWNHSGSDRVMYIGKANYDSGNPKERTCSSTLQSRVETYMKFGHGKAIGHWGGRYLWQLADASEFDVWYKVSDYPQTEECNLIQQYQPFANLKDGDNIK